MPETGFRPFGFPGAAAASARRRWPAICMKEAGDSFEEQGEEYEKGRLYAYGTHGDDIDHRAYRRSFGARLHALPPELEAPRRGRSVRRDDPRSSGGGRHEKHERRFRIRPRCANVLLLRGQQPRRIARRRRIPERDIQSRSGDPVRGAYAAGDDAHVRREGEHPEQRLDHAAQLVQQHAKDQDIRRDGQRHR